MVKGAVRSRLLLAGLGLVCVLVAAVTVPAASGYEVPSLTASFSFRATPSKLPRTKPRPVRLAVAGQYRADYDFEIPALKELRFEGDGQIELDLKGVPPCRLGGRAIRVDRSDGCPESVVGRGAITVGIEFPGERVIPTTARLTLWSLGRKRGSVQLLAYAFLTAPVVAEIRIPVKVRRVEKGRIGWEARAAIPEIAGGFGSILDYSLTIGKRFLSATCGDGRLELRAASTFVDGTRLSRRRIRTCAVAEADVRK